MSSPPASAKFQHPTITASGAERASVPFDGLRTLWVNTGTVCNLSCAGCYIELSPQNDRLSWFLPADLQALIAQAHRLGEPLAEVGFTGGEPFANPQCLALFETALAAGLRILILSNATTPLSNHRKGLLALHRRYAGQITVRVSLDHPTAERHDALRGAGMFARALDGIRWLSDHAIPVAIAGRARWGEAPEDSLAAYQSLFSAHGLPVLPASSVVIFPEMTDPACEAEAVPEITTACWDLLHLSPSAMMCASARMAVRRRGAEQAVLLACTLITEDPFFDFGPDLAAARGPVSLKHPHCARFCVLGGARCGG